MDLTESYLSAFPPDVIDKYEFAETRNAASIFRATNPDAFEQLTEVLEEFVLKKEYLLKPGGQESDLAKDLNRAFRSRGWRAADADTTARLLLKKKPFLESETESELVESETVNLGYEIDNFRDRVALDIEWNAKDGNLDRDISTYRALYESSFIDLGVIISRTHYDLRDLGRKLAREAGKQGEDVAKILRTTTTTNSEKLIPRMRRGDSGGCPLLAVFLSPKTFVAE